MAIKLRQRGRAAVRLNGVPGEILRLPITIAANYARELVALVDKMYAEFLPEVEKIVRADPPGVMDATGSYADMLGARMGDRFQVLFGKAANPIVFDLMKKVDGASERGMTASLRELGVDQLTLKSTDLSPAVRNTLQQHISTNVDLIKLIPKEFLDDVKKDVHESIIGGEGLKTLLPKLEERYGEAKRHAHNVALDQTRKAYNDLNASRMVDAGIKKFEWIHTGGSNQPRPWHMHRSPNGLNGGIFELDNPPIIVKETGERGLPGQAIYCRCTMRPVVTFD